MYRVYCYFTINEENIEEFLNFIEYAKDSKIIAAFKKIIIHIDNNLINKNLIQNDEAGSKNFKALKDKVDILNTLKVSNYSVTPGKEQFLNLKFWEEMHVNTNVFKECEMILTDKVLYMIECFPLSDLLKGEYFT